MSICSTSRVSIRYGLLIAPFLQALDFKGQSWILVVDGSQNFPVIQRIAVRSLFFVKMCTRDDGVDQVALILHQPQSAFKMRFSGIQFEGLTQNVHALIEIRFRLHLTIDRGDESRKVLPLLLLDVVAKSLKDGIVRILSQICLTRG